MKKYKFFSRALMLALILVLVLTMTSFAASTSKRLSTNYTVVNMGSETANVLAEYYRDNGASWGADGDKTSFSVLSNFGQKTIAQYFDTTMSAGQGSAVLNSSQPLSVVVQIQARNQVPTNGAYVGLNQPSNRFYAPLVIRNRNTANGFSNTVIIIQNTQQETITARVEFIGAPGFGFANFTKQNISIPANSSYYYDVETESASNLPNGWFGSAVISTVDSSKKIAVVVNIFNGADGLQTMNAFPAEMASTSWAIPQFASRLPNSFNTVLNIQNVSNSTIAAGGIQLNCTPGSGYTGNLTVTNPNPVPPNATFGVNPVTNTAIRANWQGACFLTASQNVVAFSALRQPGVTQNISAYEAVQANGTNTRVVVPLMAKRLANGFATNAVIMNLDRNNAANVRLTYKRAEGFTAGQATYTLNVTIPAGGNLQQNMRLAGEPAGLSIPSGWQGSLLVEPQPGQPARPLVGYVQLTNISVTNGDTWMSHTAFTLP
jgi:hypothetical protein